MSKRKRDPISYKEPSSDIDLSDDSENGTPSSKRVLPSRRSARQQISQAESSRHRHRAVSPAPPAADEPTHESKALSLRRKRKVSYRDVSTDDESDEDFELEQGPESKGQPRALRPGRSPSKKRARGRPKGVLGAPLKRRPGMT